MLFIPSEILCDVNCCLTRNEIEQNQLVSKQWNYAILQNISPLPLRLMAEMRIFGADVYTRSVRISEDGSQGFILVIGQHLTIPYIKTLKYCLFKTLLTKEECYKGFINVLSLLYIISGSKINVINFEILPKNRSIAQENYGILPKISQFANIHKFKKHLSKEEAKLFFIDQIRIPMEVKKLSLSFGDDTISSEIAKNLTSEKLWSFIKSYSIYGASRFSIKLKRLPYEMLEELLEFYMDEKAPRSVFHSIKINNEYGVIKIFTDFISKHSLEPTIREKIRSRKEKVYAIRTNQGHVMKLIFYYMYAATDVVYMIKLKLIENQ